MARRPISPRAWVRRVHLWLGLSLGALMVLAGVTGALLVFYVEIDRALHPALQVAGHAGPADWDRAAVTLHATFPQRDGPWRLELTGRDGAIPARYYHPAERAGAGHAPLMAWLSPDGGRVLRAEFWGDGGMTWIYDLHYCLKLGPLGGTILGWAGLALAMLLASGIWAWWPRGGWAKALRFKAGAAPLRRLYDWHKLAGLAGAPLLLLLTLTGVMLALPQETDSVLAPVLGQAQKAPVQPADAAPGRDIPVSRAVAVAQAALPGARAVWVELPGRGQGAYRLRLAQPADPSPRFPHSWVMVDRHSGAVLATADLARGGAMDIWLKWLHPLHDGSAAGLPLRLAVVLAGLVPVALYVTGVWRWWIRRRP
ncbi:MULTISPECIES: PepSY domain-containing protein [unclassified Novosphingobium]|uniref:PepSY-associated TM helix domain-containing protein n=1 Tax=unclassified Novosphingobium TaxID=2644732 RepID=UPI00146E271E|nr:MULTISPECIES: PepSY domain-containing protein [unclassified Novosphingobium]NMN07499.1 putative iron-regulated membrane protein [Novosphingobium sp. SG919]NMN89814.1 putative iron-regulated membrane protein [Novosphingobium sp. SG916]